MSPTDPGKRIDPAEISAFIDGELSAPRAREMEAAVASSPALRAELAALGGADRAWRAAATSASFEPEIRLPHRAAARISLHRAAAGAVLLLAARALPKLSGSLLLDLILNAIALGIVVIWVVRMIGTGATLDEAAR